MPWECFLVEPAGRAVLQLRRFSLSENDNCTRPNSKFHNAMAPLTNVTEIVPKRGEAEHWPSHEDAAPPHDDERWPTSCEYCGYKFSADDHFQVYSNHIFQRVDDKDQHWLMNELPIGAMFDAFWLPWTGSDGQSLSVITPPGGINHVWHIDMPVVEEGSRQPWSREGNPPQVTASPSILTPKYHGNLQNGVLTDSLSDRPDPFA